MRTHKRRGHDSNGRFQNGQKDVDDVSSECLEAGHIDSKGSSGIAVLAGDTWKADERIRTADPFITRSVPQQGWKWRIACYYCVLCMVGGLLLLYVFGGNRVL